MVQPARAANRTATANRNIVVVAVACVCCGGLGTTVDSVVTLTQRLQSQHRTALLLVLHSRLHHALNTSVPVLLLLLLLPGHAGQQPGQLRVVPAAKGTSVWCGGGEVGWWVKV